MVTLTKIEFIKKHFPEYINIDPRFDRAFIESIVDKLIEYKYYKKWSEHIEHAVVNIILKAQNNYSRRKTSPVRLNKKEKV